MANSRFEYVKSYEQQFKALPETYVVIRIDGRGFTKFCEAHNFEKPNDDRALGLIWFGRDLEKIKCSRIVFFIIISHVG